VERRKEGNSGNFVVVLLLIVGRKKELAMLWPIGHSQSHDKIY